jgi:hypothetical protein
MGDSNDRAASEEDGGGLGDLISELWRQGRKAANGRGSRGTGKAHLADKSDTLAQRLQRLCDTHAIRPKQHLKRKPPAGPQP